MTVFDSDYRKQMLYDRIGGTDESMSYLTPAAFVEIYQLTKEEAPWLFSHHGKAYARWDLVRKECPLEAAKVGKDRATQMKNQHKAEQIKQKIRQGHDAYADLMLTDGSNVYGIPREALIEKFVEQGGICPICGRSFEEHNLRVHIDHAHAGEPHEGCVRGFLCDDCNTKGMVWAVLTVLHGFSDEEALSCIKSGNPKKCEMLMPFGSGFVRIMDKAGVSPLKAAQAALTMARTGGIRLDPDQYGTKSRSETATAKARNKNGTFAAPIV